MATAVSRREGSKALRGIKMGKHSIITTIKELLILNSKGRSEEQIFYEINLNTALLQKYLEFLLEFGLLEVSKKPGSIHYKITSMGNAFLADLKRLKSL